VFLCGLTFPYGRLHRGKKDEENKGKCLNQNYLVSASGRTSTERRKTKKNFFVIFCTKEGLKTKKKYFSVILCTKRGFF
jgi:hypothetical protein